MTDIEQKKRMSPSNYAKSARSRRIGPWQGWKMNNERIAELRLLCAEYERRKSAVELDGLTHEAVAGIADVGIKALQALPELLDYIQKIEDAKAQFLQTILDQNKRYQERYSTVQQMVDQYNNMNNASALRIGGMGCFLGVSGHDKH